MSDNTPEFETVKPMETAETATLPDDAADTAVLPDTLSSEADSEPEVTASATQLHRARTRWAGIVWGTIFAAVALATALIVTSPQRRDAFGGWLASLTPGGFVLVGVLALGCLILVLGLLAAVRRLQRRRAAS